MAKKITASFPPGIDLGASYIVRLTAISPTTGALVAGVTISNISILADTVTPLDQTPGDVLPDVSPLFVPEPIS